MRTVALATLAFLLLPGCLECGGHSLYNGADWRQPGLFERMGGAGQAIGASMALDFSSAPVPGARLVSVAWHPPRQEVVERYRFRLGPDLVVGAAADDHVDPERLRREFLSFAANATRADAALREAWAQHFLANRTATEGAQAVPSGDGWLMSPVSVYRVQIGLLDLSFLAANATAGSGQPAGVGNWVVRHGGWELYFRLPVLRAGAADGSWLEVDAADQATFRSAKVLTDRQAFLDSAQSIAAAAGWGWLALRAEDVTGAIC